MRPSNTRRTPPASHQVGEPRTFAKGAPPRGFVPSQPGPQHFPNKRGPGPLSPQHGMDSPGMETGREGTGMDRARHVHEALERHEASLMAYALSIAGDVETARDAVQDTFLRLCEQPAEAVDGHVLPWLLRVCRNRLLDVHRKQQRMTAMDEGAWARQPANEASPAEEAEARDNARNARRLIEALPPNQREVVRLRFEHQLTYEEIARVTSLTSTHVGFLLHTALRTLRERMQRLDVPAVGARP